MKSDIQVCSAWRSTHGHPVYTLSPDCPKCGADAVNSAPASFDPGDQYGRYRRALKERGRR